MPVDSHGAPCVAEVLTAHRAVAVRLRPIAAPEEDEDEEVAANMVGAIVPAGNGDKLQLVG